MKIKFTGRKPGSAGKKRGYPATMRLTIRCTDGFIKTVEQLQDKLELQSPADVLHEALRHFALSKKPDKNSLNWINQIL